MTRPATRGHGDTDGAANGCAGRHDHGDLRVRPNADLRGIHAAETDARARLSRAKIAARNGCDHATRIEGWQAGDLRWRFDNDCRDGQRQRCAVVQAARDSTHAQVVRSGCDTRADRHDQSSTNRGVGDKFSSHLIRTSADHVTLERQINVENESVFRDYRNHGLT